jgi:hypothetical protein
LKRIGLISDTHSHIDEKYKKYFESCDEIWHAGDIGNLAVTDYLASIAPLRVVYGNIDNHIIRAEFPLNRRFIIEGIKVLMTHIGGRPYAYSANIKEEITKNPPQLFICGHSHICKVQMDKKLNSLYVNPGAAGVHGIHHVRTIMRFTVDSGMIKDMEVIELGKMV